MLCSFSVKGKGKFLHSSVQSSGLLKALYILANLFTCLVIRRRLLGFLSGLLTLGLRPVPGVSAVYTGTCCLHRYVLSTQVRAVYTGTCCLHRYVLSTQVRAIYTGTCCLHRYVLSTQVRAIYTGTCCLHRYVLSRC